MNKLFRNYLFLLIPVLAMLVVSCKDDEDPVLEPSITSVSPSQGLPGETVTITGTNLATATVTFGNNNAVVTNNTATSITTTVPTEADPGSTTITVTTTAGSDSETFTVLEDTGTGGDEVTITQVNPATGGPGQQVVITGTNFTGATSIMVGDTEVAAEDFEISDDGTTITFTIPADATEGFTGPITVTPAEGDAVTSADDVTFTFDADAVAGPTITSVDPETMTGAVDDVVTIEGTGFEGAEVFFVGADGTEVQATVDDTSTPTTLIFTIPEGAQTGVITIRIPTTEAEVQTEEFTIGSGETTITAVSPATGGPNQVVTITGTNFTGATGLMIGETEVAAEDFEISDDGRTISFTIPEGTTEGFTGPITVTPAEGDAVVSGEGVEFTFDANIVTPTITTVDPEAMTGAVGDVVTVTGTGLKGAEVFFMGEGGAEVQAEVDATSTPENLVFTVPEGAQTGVIIIRIPEGGEVRTEEFTVEGEAGQAINENGSLETAEVGAIETQEGAITGWSFAGIDAGLATFEIVEDEVQEGTRSLAVTINELGTNPWDIEVSQSGIEVEPNTTYTFSVWAKGPEGATANFTVGLPEEGEFAELGKQEAVAMTGEWQEVTFDFTTGDDNLPIRTPIHFSIEGNVGQTIFIDNLQVTPAE